MRMSLLSEVVFATGCVPSVPKRASLASGPPPNAPGPDRPLGPYCIRVDITLGDGSRGLVAMTEGEGRDWDVLTRTVAHCEAHEKLGLKCGTPDVKVLRGEKAEMCIDKVKMKWF